MFGEYSKKEFMINVLIPVWEVVDFELWLSVDQDIQKKKMENIDKFFLRS